ncbi:hypothetical protein F5884DRAFT_766646 [Xylogone sp. PMI_703]|nr:hypothetical protein F5884DRAFT_766646 [Xylogone sp. PMI_703]
MDALLPKLLSFPPHPPPAQPLSDHSYDKEITALIDVVKGIPDKRLLLQTSGGENPLDVINPALNTVPYIYILNAHISSREGDPAKLWVQATNFLETFDPRQIRYLGEEFTKIIDAVAYFARQNQQPETAIPPIRQALIRLDPSGSILTSHHLLLVKLALESRSYDAVLPVLDKPILYFPGSTSQPKPHFICDLDLPSTSYVTASSGLTLKLKYQDVLEYFLYSAMVYIGLKNWDMAVEYLENAITYPGKDGGVSKIMVEAYKKWVLVELLLHGRTPSLPKTTTTAAAKTYSVLGKPYETVALIFQQGTAARLRAEVEAGAEIWQGDCNTGLIIQVLAAYQKYEIRNLAKTYSKISVSEVLSLTMSAETGDYLPSAEAVELLIRQMIADGSLQASLSPSSSENPGVLTFSPTNGPVLSEVEIQKELAAATKRIQALTQEIKQTDRSLTHEKEYIKHAQKQKKNAKNGLEGGVDPDWNAVDDEDIMTGIY